MKLYYQWIILSFCCMYLSCTKPDDEPSASYQISGRQWNSDYVDLHIFDGFMIIEINSSNEFDVDNRVTIRVAGTQAGDYPMNKDMFESTGFMTTTILKWDPLYYSTNSFYPDTLSSGQIFSINSIDFNRKSISAEFDFFVINGSNGRSERIKGIIRNAEFNFKLDKKYSLIEMKDDNYMFGVMDSNNSGSLEFNEIDFVSSVSINLPDHPDVGSYDISSLPGFNYSNTHIFLPVQNYTGNVTILEKNITTALMKAYYEIQSVYSLGSTSKINGYFTAPLK